MRIGLALVFLASLALVGCGSSAAATNEDAKAISAELDASKRGVQSQPDTDVLVAPPAGGGSGAGTAPKGIKPGGK